MKNTWLHVYGANNEGIIRLLIFHDNERSNYIRLLIFDKIAYISTI